MAAQARLETTGKPARIVLTPDRTKLKADGQDIAVIECSIVDAEGRIVPTAENEVTNSIVGKGYALSMGSGNPSSLEGDQSSSRRAFGGRCALILWAVSPSFGADIAARAPDLLAGICRVDLHR